MVFCGLNSTLDLEGLVLFLFKTHVPFFSYFRSAEITTRHVRLLVLGFGEANWEGNFVAGVWRSCISQTHFKKIVVPKGQVMYYVREGFHLKV